MVILMWIACATDPGPAAGSTTTDTGAPPSAEIGRCDYLNPFSQRSECREYVGEAWTLEEAEADCAAPVPGGAPGAFVAGQLCPRDGILGECVVDGGGEREAVTVFPGTDPSWCGGAELGCGFSQGEFVPGEACQDGESEGVPPEQAFVPFRQVCVDPLPGQRPGLGPDGQVCTWEAVSGATEEGRRYVDYASCDPVFSQRPYYPYPPATDVPRDDSRLSDPAYMDELAWVTSQVGSSSCSCCHSAELAPSGPAGWYLEDGPIWIDGVPDAGLAMLAGWVDSTAFGAFEPEDNNGFDRSVTGVPTTDVPRMAAFLEGELARRGRTRADFDDTPPFGGVLYDQLVYEPGPCADGEGLAADGTLSWTGGPARYLYVLEPGSASPGVPPNLDLPEGTVWRLDVDHTAQPVPSGVRWGEVPSGARVAWPTSGDTPTLVSGATYYLVALLDIYQPATRCLFVAP